MLSLLVAAAVGVPVDVGRPLCERGAPEPVGFHARGFGYVAELFPPKSRQNRGARPVAYMYSVGYPGPEWRVDARRLWSAQLANAQMPLAALVSTSGHLVTLDDYQQSAEHALVIYDLRGRVVRAFRLDQLFEPADLDRVGISDCGRLWREGTKFYFTGTGDAKLYVVLPWQRAVELTLSTGALRRGSVADYPRLREIVAQPFPNEETEVWSLSLRFSSLTDVVPP